ncbi:MAG: outer membrane protein assembly factor BamD [Bacteroidales bacterium]|jgi:outer membrane protein assembly factor BamD|nr:outer membrane protein assembly factor BamD [Bacteroidales bacterium]
MKKRFVFLIVVLVTLASCSQYERLRKSTNYSLKYRKAFEYYGKEDYIKAGQLFDDIVSIYSGTNKADTVLYYQAMSYFKQKDYSVGALYFSSFIKKAPTSPFAEECEYLAGYCYYKQSPRAELDQEVTNAAIESFQMFIMHYPTSKFREDAAYHLAEMQDKLVDKSYLTAKLYFNLSQYKSSIVALNNSLNDYPETKYREELMFLLLKSSYLYAENSIAKKQKERYQSTLDEYYSFIGEFPKSNYAKEAQKMYDKADSYLKNRITEDEDEKVK